MASTLTSILLHVCFSTKQREDLIPKERLPELAAYLGGVCRNHSCALRCFGGTTNHVHLLLSLSKNISLAEFMMQLKRDSSKWMRETVPDFGWQDGYFAFSIGESLVPVTKRYLESQEEHHRTRDFREEMREFCKKHGVELQEEYAWR